MSEGRIQRGNLSDLVNVGAIQMSDLLYMTKMLKKNN